MFGCIGLLEKVKVMKRSNYLAFVMSFVNVIVSTLSYSLIALTKQVFLIDVYNLIEFNLQYTYLHDIFK